LSDLQQMAFANRVHAAELVLPQLLQACAASRDHSLEQACRVLAAWDRRADLGSRGALLFREFWNSAAALPGKWAVPLDLADPVNTPRGLTPAATSAMLRILHDTVQRLQRLEIPLDAPLGNYQGHTGNKLRIPIHGAIGDIDGSYNSIHMRSGLDAKGYHDVAWGTSYVQTVTFDDDGPIAHALLLYGQSVDPKSPWYLDQLGMYSRKQWSVIPFSAERIKDDPNFMATTLAE
jgi:acyl-homoserine-lactone acylase